MPRRKQMAAIAKWAIDVTMVRRALAALVALPRYPKRAILAANDVFIQVAAIWLGFSLRYGEPFFTLQLDLLAIMALAPVLGVVSLFGFSFYRNVTRFMSGRTINTVIVAISLAALVWAFSIFMTGVLGVPRVAVLIYVVLSTIGIWGSRQIAGWLLRSSGAELARPEVNRLPVIIYGAGQTAVGLAEAMERSDRYVPVAFVDRTPSLWGQYVGGYKVYRPDRLPNLVDRRGVKEIVIALAHSSRSERRSVLQEVEPLGVAIRTLPSFDELASGRVTTSDVRPIEANDLLGRDPVPPNLPLMRKSVSGKNVLVTGAGGSIGSELSRQLVQLAPRRLVLLDAAENALFEIHQQLQDRLKALADADKGGTGDFNVDLVLVLGSVGNAPLMRDVMRENDIETIYHAAAHKHVPIIEDNVVQGLENNTFGTLTLATTARDEGVERFVLVSTDKAVRPTNVMGASKRLAEIVLQTMAADPGNATVFTMVRFGNVLDSSGSVVRRFRQQILQGGPVTVTHPDMIRYFMSIPEAASLVIQAGAMAEGGEVFLLDMGEAVKIDTLARSMIQLAGFKVRDAETPDGDIAINYVGLRPGEKLREELLIGSGAQGTDHARIQRSNEPGMTREQLDIELAALRDAMSARDLPAIQAVLGRTVEGYRQKLTEPRLAERDSAGYEWTSIPSKVLH